MTQYDNTNRGALFDNDRKESDRHPDMTGTLNINGVDHWFSGWWKDSETKGEYLSLSIGDPKERQQQQRQRDPEQSQRRGNRPSNSAPQQRREPERRQAAPQQRASSGFDDMDDDIPF